MLNIIFDAFLSPFPFQKSDIFFYIKSAVAFGILLGIVHWFIGEWVYRKHICK